MNLVPDLPVKIVTHSRPLRRNWDSAESKVRWYSRQESRTQTANGGSRRFNKMDLFKAQIALAIFYFLLSAVTFFSYARSSNMLWIMCQNMQRATTDHQTRVTAGRLSGLVVALEASGERKFHRAEWSPLRNHHTWPKNQESGLSWRPFREYLQEQQR